MGTPPESNEPFRLELFEIEIDGRRYPISRETYDEYEVAWLAGKKDEVRRIDARIVEEANR